MATVFRSPIINITYAQRKAQPEYVVSLNVLFSPNPAQPFTQTDWPKAHRARRPQDASAPANLNPLYYTVVVSAPFYQDIWDSAVRARPKTVGESLGTLNPLLTPNPSSPFNQDLWDPVAPRKARATGEAVGTDAPLLNPNPARPFKQDLWDLAARRRARAVGEVRRPPDPVLTPNPSRPFVNVFDTLFAARRKPVSDEAANFLPLQAVPIIFPFSQSDWRVSIRHPVASKTDDFGIPLTLRPVPPPSTNVLRRTLVGVGL